MNRELYPEVEVKFQDLKGEWHVSLGVFHQWGSEVKEDWNDPDVQFSVGIVELKDGSIKTIHPEMIKFLEPVRKIN